MANKGYPVVPSDASSIPQWIRTAATVINSLRDGKINATGEVTLGNGSATTTLTDKRIGPNSCIQFMPTTANAAADLANLYVTARTNGSATLNHTNNAQTDRTYCYSILG